MIGQSSSLGQQVREERDQPLAADDRVLETIAHKVAGLRPPFSIGQRRDLDAIAAALQRLADGGRL